MAGGFGTTQWSLVLAARDGETERSREALSELCQTYWYPLYCLIRRSGHDADEAADLTQGFFVHLIEKEALGGVDPALGRFRSFLVVSVKNFLANEHDRLAARKRGGGWKPVTFDADDVDRRHRSDARVSQAGRSREYERLNAYRAGEGREGTYRQVAASLETTEAAVKTAVHRMRRRFGKAVREEIMATVGDPEEVDAEIRYLLEALEG